jgi:hypothetical protein
MVPNCTLRKIHSFRDAVTGHLASLQDAVNL